MGQVLINLEQAIVFAKENDMGLPQWFTLDKRNPKDVVSGQISVKFRVMEKVSNEWAEQLTQELEKNASEFNFRIESS